MVRHCSLIICQFGVVKQTLAGLHGLLLLISLPLTSSLAVPCLRDSACLLDIVGHGYGTLSTNLLSQPRVFSFCASVSCRSDSTPFHALSPLLQKVPDRLPPLVHQEWNTRRLFRQQILVFVDDHCASHLSAGSAAI